MLAFWQSVADLRRIELVAILLGILTPILCGTVLLSVRHRIKALLAQSSQSLGFSHQESVRKLESQTERLEKELATAERELTGLRRVTAPRKLSESDETAIVERLSGVQAAPAVISALAEDEESYAYASQIAAALRRAGWKVSLNRASMNDFKGVGLGSVNLMRRPLAGGRELAAALSAAHVDARQREFPAESIAGSLEDGSLLVVVGRK